MGLTLKSFAQFKSELQAGIIALTTLIDDFSSGSVAAALTEVISTQLGFVQSQAPIVLSKTRATTSSGADLASFTADYNLQPPGPLPPTYATDLAIFSRNQPSLVPQILLDGTIIQNLTPSPTSALQYVVSANVMDPSWSANAGGGGFPGRTLPPNQTSITVKIVAVKAGKIGNVVANTLTLIASPGVPFDSVTNPNSINNGFDGETDPQLRQRFSDYFSSRSGTRFAIAAATAGVQAGLSFTLNDFKLPDQSIQAGHGTIVVDDGTGNPSSTLLDAITAAVTAVTQKSFGAFIHVIVPTIVPVQLVVSGTTIAYGFSVNDVRMAISAAITAAINANGVGGAPAGTGSRTPTGRLSYVALANLVATFIGRGPGQGLSSYGAIALNGGQADVPLSTFQLARAASVTVT